MLINIPFTGFYNSLYSDAIDSEEEQFIGYGTDSYDKHNEDNEVYFPKDLRLDESELGEILMHATDYRKAYAMVAQDYMQAFDTLIGEALEMTRKEWHWKFYPLGKKSRKERHVVPSIGLKFESMESPRYYNFETDRIFANVSQKTVRELFKLSKTDNHSTLAGILKNNCTSYDGFISHYSNKLTDWLEKPLLEWDANELRMLLLAVIEIKGLDESLRTDIYDSLYDKGTFRTAWDNAVNWQEFDSERLTHRGHKLAEWLENDKENALTWCEHNEYLFKSLVQASPDDFTLCRY